MSSDIELLPCEIGNERQQENSVKAFGMVAYLETARETEPFDPSLFDDVDEDEYSAEDIEDMRRDDVRQCTRDLLLIERAKECLLEEET